MSSPTLSRTDQGLRRCGKCLKIQKHDVNIVEQALSGGYFVKNLVAKCTVCGAEQITQPPQRMRHV